MLPTCTKCSLHKTRKTLVQFRGECPCQVIFIGEAPGPSEDCLGEPFVGPSGGILDTILELCQTQHDFTWGITNCVQCIPWGVEIGKVRKPTDNELELCRPRLHEIVRRCNPVLIVAVGQVAQEQLYYLPLRLDKEERLGITHPAAILRQSFHTRTPKIFHDAAKIVMVLDGLKRKGLLNS